MSCVWLQVFYLITFMSDIKNVDAYIAQIPKAYQAKITQLRKTILSAVPLAQEKISYGMPYYSYKGKLIYFQLHTHHIGVYIPSPILAEFKEELASYETTEATIRIPLTQALPIELIRKMVKARANLNDKKENKQ